MTRAQLLEAYQDPWSYSLKQAQIVEACSSTRLALVPEAVWAQSSWQITARRVQYPDIGAADLVKRCAFTLQKDPDVYLESTHLVPARPEQVGGTTVFRGQVDVRSFFRARANSPTY